MWYFDIKTQMVIKTNDPDVISKPELVAILEEDVNQILHLRDVQKAYFKLDAEGKLEAILPTIGGGGETEDERMARIAREARAERDKLLAPALDALSRHRNQKDYDIPSTLTDAEAKEVALYAEYLRKIPQQQGFPEVIDWPEKPTCLN